MGRRVLIISVGSLSEQPFEIKRAATHFICLEGEGHGCAEDAGGPAAGKNGGLQCAQSYKRLGDEDIMF